MLTSAILLSLALFAMEAGAQLPPVEGPLAKESSSRKDDAQLAFTRDRAISRTEVLAWCALEGRACQSPRRLRLALKDLVVRAELRRKFHELSLASETFESQRSLLLDRLAARLLHRHLADSLPEPSTLELQQLFEAIPEHQKHRRWRVLNLFRRFPEDSDPEVRAELRREMAAYRERIVQGEDFAELARQHSDSETRLRGGALGLLTLDRVDTAVAEALAPLSIGDLSAVIETAQGLTLLKVTAVFEPAEASFAAAEEKLSQRWRNQELEELKQQLDSKLLPGLQGHAAQANRRLLAARAEEARKRGLTQTPEALTSARQIVEKLEAQEAANILAKPNISKPTLQDIRSFFNRMEKPFIRPRKRHLQALTLTIDSSRPAKLYATARKLGQRAAAAELSFHEVHEHLQDVVIHKDLGWLTDKQVWLLGLNVDHAVRDLKPGQSTPWVQEGQVLQLIQLLAIQEEAALDFEQSRERIVAKLQEQTLREAGLELYESILEEVDFRFTANAPQPAASGRRRQTRADSSASEATPENH